MFSFSELFELSVSQASAVISVSMMLIAGLLMTEVTKRLHIPDVTGYIAAGILIGPYCLDLVPQRITDGMNFLPDIALAFIAFGTGEFFRFREMKKSGAKVLMITLFEALAASFSVFTVMYCVLGLELPFSIVLAALASTTAPASTMMTIRQTGARGDFVNTLLQVVALDDIVGLFAYSMAISFAISYSSGETFGLKGALIPLVSNIVILLLGGTLGLIMKRLLSKMRSDDGRLMISLSFLFAFCGICSAAGVSPLLGCMSMGMVYRNLSDDKKLFKQLNGFCPPLLLLFFVRSGMNFRLDILFSEEMSDGDTSLLLVGVVYFIIRIFGKYSGAYLGCIAAKKDKKNRYCLGLALIPQAGVAIGLAVMGAEMLGGESGKALETVILASGVLYELVGPSLAKKSLCLSGSYPRKATKLTNVKESKDCSLSEKDAKTYPKANYEAERHEKESSIRKQRIRTVSLKGKYFYCRRTKHAHGRMKRSTNR